MLGSLIIGIIQLIGSYSPVKASRKLFLLVSIVGNLGLSLLLNTSIFSSNQLTSQPDYWVWLSLI